MIEKMDRQKFVDCIVGQADSGDYSESGYVAVVFNGMAAISHYSHCSCFDTWDAIDGVTKPFNEIKWDWTGTIDELVKMATDKSDPDMPTRAVTPQDCDYGFLIDVYSQVLEWHKKLKGE